MKMNKNSISTCRLLMAGLFLLTLPGSLKAQDPRERNYMYPALNPIHEPKPLVTGWATQRVTEKFNRGLTAIQTDSRTVYLSWRLLAEDPPQTSFNIYREENGKKGLRINKKPLATTTDFKDQLPGKITGVSYYVTPVIAGKELKPSEKVSVVLSQEFKNYRSIKLQGDTSHSALPWPTSTAMGRSILSSNNPTRELILGGNPIPTV